MSEQNNSSLTPKSVPLPLTDAGYTCLLRNGADSVSMKSGHVVLAPGENVGGHSTQDNEEILVPLSGEGELRVPGRASMAARPGCVLYNPPQTMHDVVNTIFLLFPGHRNFSISFAVHLLDLADSLAIYLEEMADFAIESLALGK